MIALVFSALITMADSTLFAACDECYNHYADSAAGHQCAALYAEYGRRVTINRLVSWARRPEQDLPADLHHAVAEIARERGQTTSRCLDSLLTTHAKWYPQH